MVIELVNIVVPAYNSKEGSGTFQVTGGKTLKIESTPDGIEILNATVPGGKVWNVHVRLDIVESDA